ncbi:putative methyltransferase DDB_G0268948 isoform X1 [Watersipora subatra]|uniref:putative methyltransferase DDB_G0268948 isoform X1 n=1 Tax=Watersipora subatra TaxID=2589382 RepID=UPI00355C41A9
MGTRYFADKQGAQNYAIYRPSYPDSVFASCINFLKNGATNEVNKFPFAVDVGCGTGHQSTVPLAKYFDSVLGIDISKEQISEAKKSKHPENVDFKVSAGEALPVENETVSLLQVAAAAHWMDLAKFYKEADRVLTPGGVVALYSYAGAAQTSNHPKSAEIDPILKEIAERPVERGFFVPGNDMVRRRYTDECFQIPYSDKTRIDNIPHPITNTVEDYIKFCKTLSQFRRMEEAEPDLTKQWMEDATSRLLNALETTDMSSQFTYYLEVHMLLGRKPHQPK